MADFSPQEWEEIYRSMKSDANRTGHAPAAGSAVSSTTAMYGNSFGLSTGGSSMMPPYATTSPSTTAPAPAMPNLQRQIYGNSFGGVSANGSPTLPPYMYTTTSSPRNAPAMPNGRRQAYGNSFGVSTGGSSMMSSHATTPPVTDAPAPAMHNARRQNYGNGFGGISTNGSPTLPSYMYTAASSPRNAPAMANVRRQPTGAIANISTKPSQMPSAITPTPARIAPTAPEMCQQRLTPTTRLHYDSPQPSPNMTQRSTPKPAQMCGTKRSMDAASSAVDSNKRPRTQYTEPVPKPNIEPVIIDSRAPSPDVATPTAHNLSKSSQSAEQTITAGDAAPEHIGTYPAPAPSHTLPVQPSIEEVLLTRLTEFLETELRKEAAFNARTETQAKAKAFLPLVQGPVTDEENAKALLAGVIERMREMGPAYGQNPDYTVAAGEKQLRDVRRRWSVALKNRIYERLVAEGKVRRVYIPADEAMKNEEAMWSSFR